MTLSDTLKFSLRIGCPDAPEGVAKPPAVKGRYPESKTRQPAKKRAPAREGGPVVAGALATESPRILEKSGPT
jgi:hypothetical protein